MKQMGKGNMHEMFEEDASKIPEKGELQGVVSLVTRQRQIEQDINELNEQLAEKSATLRRIAEYDLPDLFTELGIQEFKLEDGSKVTVKKFYQASISGERQGEAFTWLRDHGHDDLIKHEIKSVFGRGEDAQVQALVETLAKLNVNYIDKEGVHPSTLKAFVKEQIELQGENLAEGQEPFPMETFGVYIGKIAKIELPKKKK